MDANKTCPLCDEPVDSLVEFEGERMCVWCLDEVMAEQSQRAYEFEQEIESLGY